MDGATLILFAAVVFGGWLTHRLWSAPLISEADLERLGYQQDAHHYSMPVEISDRGLRTPRGVELPPLPDGWTVGDVMNVLAEIDQLDVADAVRGEAP